MDIRSLVQLESNPNIPSLRPGDTVKVNVKVVEGDRERIQVFQGVVIRVHGGGVGATFTVRRVASGVGVERIFPIHSPMVQKVEVLRSGKVKRANLYYLRSLAGKAARLKELRVLTAKQAPKAEKTEEPAKAPEPENSSSTPS